MIAGRFEREIRPVCDLRATALPPVVATVVQLNSEGDDGRGGGRRQAVLAQAFRMVCADRQRRVLWIPNAAFLIRHSPCKPQHAAPESSRLSTLPS